MVEETLQIELTRLQSIQRQARKNEVFGGFSSAERLEYDMRADRIHEIKLKSRMETERDSQPDMIEAEKRSKWNKSSETDTSQMNARQPYRSREKASSHAFTDSLRGDRRTKRKVTLKKIPRKWTVP